MDCLESSDQGLKHTLSSYESLSSFPLLLLQPFKVLDCKQCKGALTYVRKIGIYWNYDMCAIVWFIWNTYLSALTQEKEYPGHRAKLRVLDMNPKT